MKRILIVCSGLQIGGLERFAVNIIKYANQNEFKFDYLIFKGFGTTLVNEVTECGGNVLTITAPRDNFFKYLREYHKLLKDGKYDVVHCHTQFNCGISLLLAKICRVPVRIAHSHTTAHEVKVRLLRNIYEKIMRKIINLNATDCLSCGIEAGKWLYGNRPFKVITNGINCNNFKYSTEIREKIRNLYNIDKDAFVIGHTGTLSDVKNQVFLINILPEIIKKKRNTFLILAGGGSEEFRKMLLFKAKECNVSDNILLTGGISNVNELLSAFDVYCFPSLREGTPISLIEAQANGLPCIINDAIPTDAIVSDIVKRISINQKEKWIEAILSSKREDSEKYSDFVLNKGYDVKQAYASLFEIYKGK